MNILVVGGAGYIGSHFVLKLKEHSFYPYIVDSGEFGARFQLDVGEKVNKVNILDRAALDAVFSNERIDVVVHFGAAIEVAESVQRPEKYYHNNVIGTFNLLNAMKDHDVKKIIFSSTAAVYGEPHHLPLIEAHSKCPINPYGKTKLMCEYLLEDYANAYGISYVVLRYFNAAGADIKLRTGYRLNDTSHIIPVLMNVAAGEQEKFSIYGGDYKTPDGTSVRDYIHVDDLCEAHLLAIKYLYDNNQNEIFNLGCEKGYSVKELINMTEKITGKYIATDILPRRNGDPAILISDSKLAQNKLGWQPRLSDLETIIETAWHWKLKHSEF